MQSKIGRNLGIVVTSIAVFAFLILMFSLFGGGTLTHTSTSRTTYSTADQASTTTTTAISFPPPAISSSMSATTSSSDSVLSSSLTTTTTESATTSTGLIPVSLGLGCTNAGTGFYSCGVFVRSFNLPRNENASWSINKGDLSPISCTLEGNSTFESCGVLAGGSYESTFTITASYPGDCCHASGNISETLRTGPRPNIIVTTTTTATCGEDCVVTPEFPFGIFSGVMASVIALALFGFIVARRNNIR